MPRKTAAVVLNYNSLDDTQTSVPQLLSQSCEDLTLIIVDNASKRSSVNDLVRWVRQLDQHAIVGTREEVEDSLLTENITTHHRHRLALVLNTENRGYSAGNNIGLRLACRIGADHILIANPDVRYPTPNILSELSTSLDNNPAAAIVGPKVVGPKGEIQSPMFEPTFIQEVLFPFLKPWAKVANKQYLKGALNCGCPRAVHKVHGCCFMLKTTFIREIGFMDESVFMYCEEAILARQAQRLNQEVLLAPHIQVTHLHLKGGGNFSRFSESRLYYLSKYKNYSAIRLASIRAVHGMISCYRKMIASPS